MDTKEHIDPVMASWSSFDSTFPDTVQKEFNVSEFFTCIEDEEYYHLGNNFGLDCNSYENVTGSPRDYGIQMNRVCAITRKRTNVYGEQI